MVIPPAGFSNGAAPFDEKAIAASPEAVAEFLSARLPTISDLVERFRTYYSGTVTRQNAIYWLLQFGALNRVQLALRLLEGVNFVSEARLTALLKNAFEALGEEERSQVLFCPVGKAYDSALHVSYAFAKALGLREDELARRWITVDGLAEALKNTEMPIAFLDDNCTSGTQFVRFLQELMTDVHLDREHVAHRLPDDALQRLRHRPIRFAVALDLMIKPSFEAEIAQEFGFQDFRFVSGGNDFGNALELSSGRWTDTEELNSAREMLRLIGTDLYASKSWDEAKVQDRILGYGNLGKLVVFAHNVPKSLPPVFWKYGTHRARDWFPLFPERAEWHEHQKAIRNREPYMAHFAAQLDSGLYGRTSPLCTVELAEVEPSEGQDQVVLADDTLQRQIASEISKSVKPKQKIPEPSPNPFTVDLVPYGAPTRQDIVEFNRLVHQYNDQLPVYRRILAERIAALTSVFGLTFRLRNEGSAPASSAVLMIELPDDLDFESELMPLPAVPQPPITPSYAIIPSLRNYGHELLERIANKPEVGDSQPHPPRFLKDRSRRLVEVRVGRILQHTFTDVTVQYLRTSSLGGEVSLTYQLIYAEATRPIDGSISFRIARGKAVHPHVQELLQANDDDSEEE